MEKLLFILRSYDENSFEFISKKIGEYDPILGEVLKDVWKRAKTEVHVGNIFVSSYDVLRIVSDKASIPEDDVLQCDDDTFASEFLGSYTPSEMAQMEQKVARLMFRDNKLAAAVDEGACNALYHVLENMGEKEIEAAKRACAESFISKTDIER